MQRFLNISRCSLYQENSSDAKDWWNEIKYLEEEEVPKISSLPRMKRLVVFFFFPNNYDVFFIQVMVIDK